MAKILMQLDETQQTRKNLDGVIFNMTEGLANIESQAISISGDFCWWGSEGGDQFRQDLLLWVQRSRDTIRKIDDLSRRIDHEQREWVDVEQSHDYSQNPESPLKITTPGYDGKPDLLDILQGKYGIEAKLSIKELLDPILPWELRYPNKKNVDYYNGFTGNAAVTKTDWGAWDSYLKIGWTRKGGLDGGFFTEGSHWKQEALTYLFGPGLGLIVGTSEYLGKYDGNVNAKDVTLGASVAGKDFFLGENLRLLGINKYIGIHVGLNAGLEFGVKWKKGISGKWAIFDFGVDVDELKELTPYP
jgi:hypothetical protein